jgi:hypothetical protein
MVPFGLSKGMPSPSFKSLIVIAISALAVVLGSDAVIRHFSPFTRAREAVDGLDDLRHSDPTILVVGSSYARTFNVLGQELAKQTAGSQRLLDIPLEAGKLSSYQWMIENRIAPLVDERDANGKLKRPSLQRFIVVTEWWDSCHVDHHTNIPGRLWTLGDFSRSVFDDGLNSYNRNYLQYLWRRTFPESALVQYRGSLAPMRLAFRRLLGRSPGPTHDPATVEAFYREGIAGMECAGDSKEIAALDYALKFATDRGLEATVVLFPFMPGMVSPEARATTYRKFSVLAEAVALKYGARLVDLVTPSPLLDEDWLPDCEHLNPRGNDRFTDWTLRGPLAFLKDEPPSKVPGTRR